MDLKMEKNCSDIPVVAPNTWRTFAFVTSLSRRFFVNSIDKEFSFFVGFLESMFQMELRNLAFILGC